MRILDKKNKKIDPLLCEKILKMSKENVFLCYQCRKCSSGCPARPFMESKPNELMRMVQLGMSGRIAEENTIWSCVSCQTCTTRCPQGIDIAHVIDMLRIMAKEKKLKSAKRLFRPGKVVRQFNSIWMRMLKYMGRVYEPALILLYNIVRMKPFKDLGLGFKMIKKGKLKLTPSIKSPIAMMKIFFKAKRLK